MTFTTVLIANRGEIALRIFRTCRRLGIRTIAVYTDLDRHALHVRAADEAVLVPSYLDIAAVVSAAKESGADAIHPGYGFLSERAEFARAVEAAGLKLVGPTADVMDKMGRKDAAREIAIKAGVPVVPSGVVEQRGTSVVETTFPILVKAAAGGGGKGMRIVHEAAEYDAAVAAARREAKSAFGDDTILVEKYVEHGRHIEVQILADEHGNVIHLFERDCSTQRRHQKVLEEAPGPTMTPEIRQRVTSAAVALAQEVGYTNAGTVEFLLDTATGEAYFLEMNTRLQVEHPVTEAICGDIDLVEQQLRIAAGEPLTLAQSDLAINGHAIEARVYAEDSFNGFLPQAGTTSIVRWPESLARVDAALESNQVVSTSFDPMLGKVIVHGPDRESTRLALIRALDETAILGLTTNVGFLRALVASDEFRDATIDTAWLDHAEVAPPGDDLARVIAGWTQAFVETGFDAHPSSVERSRDPFQADGWRLGADPAPVYVDLDGPLWVSRARGTVTDGEQTWAVEEVSAADHVVVLLIDGRRHQAVVNVQPHLVDIVHEGQRRTWEPPDVFADHGPAAGDGSVAAPMPGTVLAVNVTVGQAVAEGEVLGTMEAMKMELALKAPYAGTVTAVDAKQGDQVPIGAPLFHVEQSEVVEQRALASVVETTGRPRNA
jgi:acetyl-CoA/propionyl-CoA carboxylase biotin carboxyl carrier protein